MIRVGIFGATGYTGYELIKILVQHPQTRITFATSESSAGQRINDLYPCPYDLPLIPPAQAELNQADVVFCCLGHGEAMPLVKHARQAGVKVIDLSADFRLHDAHIYEKWYKVPHTAPELLPQAVYGLTEVYRAQIARADLIANPGCYPTGALLALYPLVRDKLLGSARVIIDSKSGVSGAGRKPSLTAHFCEVNENFNPYNIGRTHRHLSEIEQELDGWAKKEMHIIFSPHLLPVNRGILSTIYVTLQTGWSVSRLIELYQAIYTNEPFIHILPAGKLSSLAYVAHTNRCVISFAEAGDNDFIVVSAVDNLIKGASGQAVQNMNVIFGLDETLGLVG